MWTVVYMTQQEQTAFEVGSILEQKGLLHIVRPIGKTEDNKTSNCYEVLVPDAAINEAHTAIIENKIM